MTAIGFVGGGHCRVGDEARLRAAGASAVISEMRLLPPLLAL